MEINKLVVKEEFMFNFWNYQFLRSFLDFLKPQSPDTQKEAVVFDSKAILQKGDFERLFSKQKHLLIKKRKISKTEKFQSRLQVWASLI